MPVIERLSLDDLTEHRFPNLGDCCQMDSCKDCSDPIWDGVVHRDNGLGLALLGGSKPWYIPNLFGDSPLLIKIEQRHAVEDPWSEPAHHQLPEERGDGSQSATIIAGEPGEEFFHGFEAGRLGCMWRRAKSRLGEAGLAKASATQG
jgi:hypothetical protein